MNDYDRIWRRSECLIKGEHPVTYGNASQWISGCPGFSFLLLCCWWLSVPDLSRWSLSSSPQTDTHTVPSHTAHIHSLSKQQCFHLFLLVRLWSNLSLRNRRKMEEEGKWENNEVRSTDTIDQTMLCCIYSQILVLLGFFFSHFYDGATYHHFGFTKPDKQLSKFTATYLWELILGEHALSYCLFSKLTFRI